MELVSEILVFETASTILKVRGVYILSSVGVVNVGYFPFRGELIHVFSVLILYGF